MRIEKAILLCREAEPTAFSSKENEDWQRIISAVVNAVLFGSVACSRSIRNKTAWYVERLRTFFGLWSEQRSIDLALTSPLTFGKLLSLSEPLFSNLPNGINAINPLDNGTD